MFKNIFGSKPQEQTVNLLGETLEQKCLRATDKSLPNPDPELNNEVVEHIKESDRDVTSKEIAWLLRRRLQQDNIHKQYLGLFLIDAVLKECAGQLGEPFLDDMLYHVALVATRTNRRQHPEFSECKRKALEILREHGRRGQHALQLAVRSGGNPNLNLGGIISFGGGYGSSSAAQQQNHYGHLNHTSEQLGNRFYGQQFQQQIATAPDTVLIDDVNIIISQCYSYIDLIQDLILDKSDPKNIEKKLAQPTDDQFNEDILIKELLNETQKLKEQLPQMLQRLQSMEGPEAETTLIQSLEATDILDNAIKLHAEVVHEAQKAEQEQRLSNKSRQDTTTRQDSTLGDLLSFDQLASHSHAQQPAGQQSPSFQPPPFTQNSFQAPSTALTPYQPPQQGQGGAYNMGNELDSLARQTTSQKLQTSTSNLGPSSGAMVLYEGQQGQGGNQQIANQGQPNQSGNQQFNQGYGYGGQGYQNQVQPNFAPRQLSKTTSNIQTYSSNLNPSVQTPPQSNYGASMNSPAYLSPRYNKASPQGGGLYPQVGVLSGQTPSSTFGQNASANLSPSTPGQLNPQNSASGSQYGTPGGQPGYGGGNLNVTGAGYASWQQQQQQQQQSQPQQPPQQNVGSPYNQNLTVTGANYSQSSPSLGTGTQLNVQGGFGTQNKNNPFTYIDPVDRLRQQTSYQTTPMNAANQNQTPPPYDGSSQSQSGQLAGFPGVKPVQKGGAEGNQFYGNANPGQAQVQSQPSFQTQQSFQPQQQQGYQATPQRSLYTFNSMGNYPQAAAGGYNALSHQTSMGGQQQSFQSQPSQYQQQQQPPSFGANQRAWQQPQQFTQKQG